MSATHLHSSWPGLVHSGSVWTPSRALASARAYNAFHRANAPRLDGRLKRGHDGAEKGAAQPHASRAALPHLEFAAASQYQKGAPTRVAVRGMPSALPPPRVIYGKFEEQLYCRNRRNLLEQKEEAL